MTRALSALRIGLVGGGSVRITNVSSLKVDLDRAKVYGVDDVYVGGFNFAQAQWWVLEPMPEPKPDPDPNFHEPKRRWWPWRFLLPDAAR